MKVLYAIQGTGNGHLSRARDVIPALRKYCATEILVSGYQADVNIPYLLDYKYRGVSFVFGQKGGIDFWDTFKKAKLKYFLQEVSSVPVENYDLVINDFEPVTAWACEVKDIPCISLSHQSAVINKYSPRPKKQDVVGNLILKKYAPTKAQYGFHFDRYAPNIFTPVIRKEIREAEVENHGYYTVYLPAYSDEKLVQVLSQIDGVRWQVFSKNAKQKTTIDKVEIWPIDNSTYIESVRKCNGLLCGAGFEAPAEAIHMGKKLMVIPMKFQFEQWCNAAALEEMGVLVLKKMNENSVEKIQEWVDSREAIEIEYPDQTEMIIQQIMEEQIWSHKKASKTMVF